MGRWQFRTSARLLHLQDWVLVEEWSPVAAACHLVSGSQGAAGGAREEDGRGSQRWLHRSPGGGVGAALATPTSGWGEPGAVDFLARGPLGGGGGP